MIKPQIKQVVIVEGKSDTANLKKYYDITTIETNGFGLTRNKIKEIITISKEKPVIIFTDQDYHGKKLREKLFRYVPSATHANLPYKHQKVGVENASQEELRQALNNLIEYSFDNQNHQIDQDLFNSLSINGNRSLRRHICDYLHIEMCNNKSLIKKLNLLNTTKNELTAIISNYNETIN